MCGAGSVSTPESGSDLKRRRRYVATPTPAGGATAIIQSEAGSLEVALGLRKARTSLVQPLHAHLHFPHSSCGCFAGTTLASDWRMLEASPVRSRRWIARPAHRAFLHKPGSHPQDRLVRYRRRVLATCLSNLRSNVVRRGIAPKWSAYLAAAIAAVVGGGVMLAACHAAQPAEQPQRPVLKSAQDTVHAPAPRAACSPGTYPERTAEVSASGGGNVGTPSNPQSEALGPGDFLSGRSEPGRISRIVVLFWQDLARSECPTTPTSQPSSPWLPNRRAQGGRESRSTWLRTPSF